MSALYPPPFLVFFFLKNTFRSVLMAVEGNYCRGNQGSLCETPSIVRASLVKREGHLDIKMPLSYICRQAATNHLLRQQGTDPRSSTHQYLP